MPTQGAQFASAGHIPQLDVGVAAPRGERLAVRREDNASNSLEVSQLGEDRQLALILGVRRAEARVESGQGDQNLFHY